jgi:predicted transposase/invertase (TIGR01784 family)
VNLLIDKRNENGFIMSPKVDFAFQLIFGDEKNKDILIDFLSSVLDLPKSEFDSIEFINKELLREFEEDKKCILDVRVKTSDGKQVNIEIQLMQTRHMPERTLFYWSKMYTGQIKSGDKYKKLKKCITINIVNYEFIPIEKIHTKFHLLEDSKNYKLTDVIEVHFLELPKLRKLNEFEDNDAAFIDWLEFINADTKGVMEVLAEKNENIDRAYKIIQAASLDEGKRLAYEARQMAIMDEATRIEEAKEEGKAEGKLEGKAEGKLETAIEMLRLGADIKLVSKGTKIPIEELEKITMQTKDNKEL